MHYAQEQIMPNMYIKSEKFSCFHRKKDTIRKACKTDLKSNSNFNIKNKHNDLYTIFSSS